MTCINTPSHPEFFSNHQGPVKSGLKSGSVLLVTLLSVSLLLIVVLTLVLTVRMELRNVTLAQDALMARGNARLGADLAVARLQELLGPDQRVSATGDLFRADLATSANHSNRYQGTLESEPEKRFWTGAWDSTAYDERNAGSKGFLGWLVSGEADGIGRVGVAVDPSSMIPLVGQGAVTDPTDQVWVAPQDIENTDGTKTGEFAFWVGDEGVKARFNLEDAHRNAATRQERQQRLQSAQRHAAEMIHLTTGTNQTQSLAAAGLYPQSSREFRERLLLMDQLPLLGWDPNSRDDYAALRRERFHDISLTSRGVFSNTRDGGLMRDLSLAFEMDLGDFLAHDFFGSGSPLSEPMPYWPISHSRPHMVPVFSLEGQELRDALLGDFPENSPETGLNPSRSIPPAVRGAPWLLLRNYYRLYQATDPDRAVYGLAAQNHTVDNQQRVYHSRRPWPDYSMYRLGRRYGQDVNAWRNAEDFGPVGRPLGRAVFPGMTPVITRLQLIFSVLAEEAPNAAGGTPLTYEVDLYLDPVVTLMNPYDVPLRIGPNVGQSLDIQLSEMDSLIRMHYRAPYRTRDVRFSDMININQTHSYTRGEDELFVIRLDVGSEMIMEPGEVVVFAGTDHTPVVYQRTGSGAGVSSGVSLTLGPGIQGFLSEESGIRIRNAFQLHVNSITDPDPERMGLDGNRKLIPGDRVQFNVREDGYRIRIAGPASGGDTPFFESLDGPLRAFNTLAYSNGEIEVQDLDSQRRDGEKFPFAILDWHLKTENDNRPFFPADHFNLRAESFEQGRYGRFHTKLYAGDDIEDQHAIQGVRTQGNFMGALPDDSGARNAFWGPSRTTTGRTHVPLFSVPHLPLQSLGAFQNLMLQPMGDDPGFIFGNSRSPLFGTPAQKVSLQTMANSMFPFGGSDRPAARGQATLTRPDWSFLYNEALWDGFFFSTVLNRAAFTNFRAGSQELPNGTLRPWGREDAGTALFSPAGGILREAPERAGAHLVREGAFNVNSTSVEAWRALLSSTRGLSVEHADSGLPRQMAGSVFSRSALPANQVNQIWSGFRELTDNQMDALAEQIVREVRIRGPFLNLADFVNRRLAPANDATRRSGPLQAAIDASGVNSGGGFSSPTLSASAAYTPWMQNNIGDHLSHPVLAGLPGYLTQADVLTVIGPMLSARSDTFTVRAFGEHGGARAWCELTVQRVPEYLEDSDAPWVRPGDAGVANQTFGRRFVITSFRWLGEDEV